MGRSAEQTYKVDDSDAGLDLPGVLDSRHLFRLFVGWVPKLFTEQDLQPLFQQCGDVKDLIILKDKVTGQPRGCAFVSFATKEEAEAAIEKLDRKVHLPGALNPLEVRFARSHQYVQAGSGPQDNRQLFFARAPAHATEEDIWQLFSKHGQVEEINLFRERRTHQSKGCGFVTLATREQAVAAMEGLDGQHVIDAAEQPLAVKWADPDLQVKKRRAVEDSNAENRMLFFAKVLRSASEEDVRAVFSKHGRVHDVNLFRAFQGAPTTKGCGLVTMGSNEEAVAAINALDNKYTWEGMDGPMVVKWMDAALQKRRREEHLAAMRQGLTPSMAALGALSASGGAVATQFAPQEAPPAGCAPDAYKLFVGNVPKHMTEDQLRPMFEQVGSVVELVVVRDKFTHESKGSAFVWFQTKAMADAAVAQFNARTVLPDPTCEQERPLVVRRANARKAVGAGAVAVAAAAVAGHSMAGLPAGLVVAQRADMLGGDMLAGAAAALPGAGLMGDLAQVPVHVQPLMATQIRQPAQAAAAYAYAPIKGAPQPSAVGQLALGFDALSLGAARADAASMGSGSSSYDTFSHAGGGLMAAAGAQGYEAQFVAAANAGMAPLAAGPVVSMATMAPQASRMLDAAGPVTFSMTLQGAQMVALQQHMYTIQAMSGAELSSQPIAPGLYCLMLSGGQAQVESAKNLVAAVLGQSGMM